MLCFVLVCSLVCQSCYISIRITERLKGWSQYCDRHCLSILWYGVYLCYRHRMKIRDIHVYYIYYVTVLYFCIYIVIKYTL